MPTVKAIKKELDRLKVDYDTTANKATLQRKLTRVINAAKKATEKAPEEKEAGKSEDKDKDKKPKKSKDLGTYLGHEILERDTREVNGKEYTYIVLDDNSTYLMNDEELVSAGLEL